MILSHIEGLRVRGPKERSYFDFLLEGRRERMGMFGLGGTPGGRHYRKYRIHSHYQSAYVNWVIDELDSGNFDLPNTGSYDTFVQNIIDPNAIRAHQFGFENLSLSAEYVQSLESQKQKEIAQYLSEIQCLKPSSSSLTQAQIRKLLNNILLPLGFDEYSSKSISGKVIHTQLFDSDFMMWHEYSDHRGMSLGRGGWSVSVYLATTSTSYEQISHETYRSFKYYSEGMLPFLLLGGNHYFYHHEGDWIKIIFGALAHAKMLELFFKHWKLAKSG